MRSTLPADSPIESWGRWAHDSHWPSRVLSPWTQLLVQRWACDPNWPIKIFPVGTRNEILLTTLELQAMNIFCGPQGGNYLQGTKIILTCKGKQSSGGTDRALISFETWIKPFLNQVYPLDFFTYGTNKFHVTFFFSLLKWIWTEFLSAGIESPGSQF